jgi:thiol peroxidase
MKGNPLTLEGQELKVGDTAPQFTLVNGELSPVSLADSSGKARLLSIVPSLDTSVCSIQTQSFNKKLGELKDKAVAYTISVDLPFAQNRFDQEHSISNMTTLSDYKDVSFGRDYGLLIKELRLLARAVIVVDKNNKVSYMQLVPEVTQEPDYDKAIDALKKVI